MTDLEKAKGIDFTSLKTILIAGLIVRLIAAVFSKGYGMHDDHFLVVEAAGSWADGFDYNHWLPWSKDNLGQPEGHSFTYVGLNFIFFKFFKFFGINDPQILMLINRIFHALFSLLVIYFGFKITEKLRDRKTAVYVGWLLALLWAMPFLSVRNLVETVSIPFMMWSVWLTIKSDNKKGLFLAGILVGVAISFRYQIALYAVGMGLYYVLKKKWNPMVFYSLGAIVSFCITQGLVDFLIWGRPFAEFTAYVVYNMHEGMGYLNNTNYGMYIYVLFGLLLFPLGIFALVGYFKGAKTAWIIFLPTLLFLAFHTWFPNRQERFILTIWPLVIIVAIIGFQELRNRKFWNSAWKVSWIGFWILNIPLLFIISSMTSKQSRMETMTSLYGKTKGNEHILIEATGETNPEMMPFFYAGKWEYVITERWYSDTTSIEKYRNDHQQYIFFFGQDSLQDRIKNFKEIYPKMELKEQIQPSLIDKTLHSINPRNSNSYVEVWKTNVAK